MGRWCRYMRCGEAERSCKQPSVRGCITFGSNEAAPFRKSSSQNEPPFLTHPANPLPPFFLLGRGGAEVCQAWSGLSWYPSRLFRPSCKAFSKRSFHGFLNVGGQSYAISHYKLSFWPVPAPSAPARWGGGAQNVPLTIRWSYIPPLPTPSPPFPRGERVGVRWDRTPICHASSAPSS